MASPSLRTPSPTVPVQARVQFPVGAYGGGLGGRLDPINGSHYAVWIYPENSAGGSNILKLLRFDSYTSFVELQRTNLTAVGTNFHTVQLRFSGSLVAVAFDGQQVLSVTDATYATGAVSLDMWTDANPYQMTVDDVAVDALLLIANNDSYSAVLGVPRTVAAPGVLANDMGGNGPLSAVLATNAAHGTLAFSSNGGFTYNATNNFTGTDTFAYRATDGQSNSTPATVTITVAPDQVPVANNDAYTMMQNATLSVAAPGVLGNDTDADGNSLTAALSSTVSHGTLYLTNNGGFTYVPATGFSGTDSFTYRANDGLSNSVPATVTIFVLSIVPLYSDDFARTDLLPWVAQSGVWAVTNGVLQGGVNSTMSYGVAYLTNTWTNYSVQASLQFPAGAFGGGIDGCLNPATGARYALWVYPEGSAGGSTTLKLIKFQTYSSFGYNGISTVPMQSVALGSVGTGSHTVKLACAGNRVAAFFDGTLMISMTDVEAQPYSSGGIGADFWTDATGYQMTVDDVLVAPLVNDDTYDAVQDADLAVAAPGVLGNDTEIYGGTLTAALVSGPAHGAVSLSTNGGFTYTPTGGYTGPDSFTYQANDGGTNLGTATVNIEVSPSGFSENFDGVTAPALPSGWTTATNGAGFLWVTRTTTSDTTPNAAYVANRPVMGTSELVSPAIVVPPGQTRLIFRNNYSLEADANAAYDGGVFEIKIGAGSFTDILAAGGSFVNGGYNRTITTQHGSPLAGRQAWSGNSSGFVTTTVNLPAAATGQTIQLRWRCGTDTGNSGNITNGWYVDTVAVTNCACSCCWNTAPILPAQSNRTIVELTGLIVNNAATDADLPAQTLTYSLLSPPANAGINPTTGLITFSPSETQGSTTNTITTRVTDNGSPSASSTNSFIVVVTESNSPPVLPVAINGTNFTMLEETTLTVVNTATDSDVPANTRAYTLTVTNASGAVANAAISTSGVITWTPTEAQGPSTNTFTTRVVDNGVPPLSATNTFTVVVSESNRPPVLPVQVNLNIAPNDTRSVTNTATDPDIPANTLTYSLLAPPAFATINTNTGVITLSPAPADGSNDVYVITTVVTDFSSSAVNSQHLSASNSFTVLVASGPILSLSSASLVLEGCLPTNNVIDAGETVTLLVALRNVGIASTTNLVATLLETNGVAAPSGPQTYGVLVAGGGAVSLPFSLTATGICGNTLIPTLQLQDGTADLGIVAASFTLGQIRSVIVSTQNFDSVTVPALPANWTSIAGGGQLNWRTTNSPVDSAPNAAFSANATSRGTNELLSPSISLSNVTGPVQLRFRNNYSMEADATTGYDGGVLEIKIGANAFVDITNAGGVFISGGYNRRISSSYQSPIAGRGAWSGTSGGYLTTSVSLPASVVGQTIQFRWRCATDNGGVSGAGWRIDSIGLTGNGYVCCSNSAPVLPGQADRTILELATLTVTNTATDSGAPPEVLTYSLLIAPTNAPANPVTNAVISTNGIITWTPSEAQGPGTYSVTTVVSDSASPALSATNTFLVMVNEVNSAPGLTVPADQTIDELAAWTANATASDSDQPTNTLTFELVSGPSGLTVSPAGLIGWTPNEDQGPGTNLVTVRVFDDGSPSLATTNSFTLTVNEVNSAPGLTVPADQTIDELAAWTANATASDSDQPTNTLTFELVSGPSGLTVSPAGLIGWTPNEDQGPGTNLVTVRVFDDGSPSLATTNSFTLTVNEVNSAPGLTVPADQTIDELAVVDGQRHGDGQRSADQHADL